MKSTAPVPALQMRFGPGLEDDAHPPVRQPLQPLYRQRGAARCVADGATFAWRL